jgi:hypothetical protein
MRLRSILTSVEGVIVYDVFWEGTLDPGILKGAVALQGEAGVDP